MSERILVTGPDGFVGRAVCGRLLRDGFVVRGAQLAPAPLPDGCETIIVGDLAAATNWPEAMSGVDRVVHLAARVHVMRDEVADPPAEYRRVNVEGTRAVAEAAAQAGVKRLVFISTVKVLGERTGGEPFTGESPPAPLDPYGVSKWEAEQVLHELRRTQGLEFTVVRPPLVYGPGVRANFLSLMNAIRRGWPLPVGGVRNRRSLVGVDNLVDFLVRCLTHPAAANETFLVSDGRDLSTAELARAMGSALGRDARLWNIPPALLKWAGASAGRRGAVERLCDSLAVEIGKAERRLGWRPPVSVEEGLRRTAEWLLAGGG